MTTFATTPPGQWGPAVEAVAGLPPAIGMPISSKPAATTQCCSSFDEPSPTSNSQISSRAQRSADGHGSSQPTAVDAGPLHAHQDSPLGAPTTGVSRSSPPRAARVSEPERSEAVVIPPRRDVFPVKEQQQQQQPAAASVMFARSSRQASPPRAPMVTENNVLESERQAVREPSEALAPIVASIPILPPPSRVGMQQAPGHAEQQQPLVMRGAAADHRQREVELRERLVEKHAEARAIKETPNDVLERQLERTLIAHRESRGEAAAKTLVPGMNDSDLWMHRRRFDLQVNHVMSPAVDLPDGRSDLRMSALPAVPFRLNVLKSNSERVVATVVFKGFVFAREMRRIMLWTPPERVRTMKFCMAYILLWAAGLLIPAFLSFLILLILYTPSRLYFFPQAEPDPSIPVPSKTPTAASSFLLSMPDPALYKDKIELVIDYAKEGGRMMQHLISRAHAGEFIEGDEGGNGTVGRKTGDVGDADAQQKREAEDEKKKDAKTRLAELEAAEKTFDEKRDVRANDAAKLLQTILGRTADACEILENALSPPAPYPDHGARKRLAAVLAPLVIIVPFLPAAFWSYATGAAFGFCWFGQPIIVRGIGLLNATVPNWPELVNPRDTLFAGVPTHMQLTLHLLRTNELYGHPLPPPPPLPTDREVMLALDAAHVEDGDELVSDDDAGIIMDDNDSIDLEEDRQLVDDADSDGEKTKGFKRKLKKAVMKAAGQGRTIGETRQKVGEQVDRKMFHSKAKDEMFNYSFPCKQGGRAGHLNLTTGRGVSPTVIFAPLKVKSDIHHPVFELHDLVELKKLGVSAKRAVLGKIANIDMEGKGLELRFKTPAERADSETYGTGRHKYEERFEGRIMTLEQVHRRDELFARLISLPVSTRWETL